MSDEVFRIRFDAEARTAIVRAIQAGNKYGDFSSAHEAYGVLAEEVRELFDAVCEKQDLPGREARIWTEALDIAAVALRLAEQASHERLKR